MKKFIIFLCLISCAKNGTNGVDGSQGPKGDQGTQGPTGPQGSPGPTPIPSVDFQGFFVLPNNSYVEIIKDSGSLYDLNQVRLDYANADLSYGIVPLSSAVNLPKQNDSVYYTGNLTYAALNNIKTDVGNTVLVGSFFTMLTFTKVNDKLNVRIEISNSATIVFDHTLVQP